MGGNETMTKRYTITDDGVTDNLSKKQYTKIKSGDNILDTISFTSLIQIVDLLNEQDQKIKELEEEVARQKYTKSIMRDNLESYEMSIKRLRKSYEEFDEMRLERIRFLEKRLKKNGLSIYVNDCYDLED